MLLFFEIFKMWSYIAWNQLEWLVLVKINTKHKHKKYWNKIIKNKPITTQLFYLHAPDKCIFFCLWRDKWQFPYNAYLCDCLDQIVCVFFRARWSCIHCKTEYDLDDIEQSLIEAVHKKSMAYVLQDLECIKCKQVSDTFI